ncbi:MAG: U32 family peptidase [Clostridiales bacterium]|nr:U32 family peptidase [Clostridiales bacterium]
MIDCKAKIKEEYKKCELLVPVGGTKQLIAAVENGADAIYFGGEISNARMKAENFNLAEVEQNVDYAHIRGVRTYVTMNTLMFDDELKKALIYASELYRMGVNALIIQDLGFAKLVHDNMPDFPIHLSTQGTVMHESDLIAAKRMGFSRVVLSRELSVEEVEALSKKNDMDLEVFVHGAMCVSMSGQCQLSRYIGGRSGNRGLCAQPCRLPYKCLDDRENNYPLSTKDLCLIDYLKEMVDMGISSLKIEGRMKSPEYVATVTRIYRKYLDEYFENGKYSVSTEDRNDLLQSFNRNGFSEGFNGGETLSKTIAKNSGVYVGKVIKGVEGTALADVKIEKEIKIGDIIEIRGTENLTNMVTYYKELGGGAVRLGDLKGKAKPGDLVYRIISKDLNSKAQVTFENNKYIRKRKIDMDIVFDNDNIDDDLEKNIAIVNRQLRKTGNTPFEVESINISGQPKNVKVSELNSVRRDAIEKLQEEIKKSYKRDAVKVTMKQLGKKDKQNGLELFFYNIDKAVNFDFSSYGNGKEMRVIVPLEEYLKLPEEGKEKLDQNNLSIGAYVLPMDSLRHMIMGNYRLDGRIKYIYVGSFGDIEIAKKAYNAVEVIADFGTNSTNIYTDRLLKDLGASEVKDSLEIAINQTGNIPLMITRHDIKCKRLSDRKGQRYKVIKKNSWEYGIFYIVTPDKVGLNDKLTEHGRVYVD